MTQKKKFKPGDKVLVLDNSAWGSEVLTIDKIVSGVALMKDGGCFKTTSLVDINSPEGQARWEQIKVWVELHAKADEMEEKLFPGVI